MSHNNILFSTVCALCMAGFTSSAMAVPTVKKLGATATTSGNRVTTGVAATPRAANTLNTSKTSNNLRTPSVRLGAAAAKPVTVSKVGTANQTNSAADNSRLTIGKYIHTSGVNSGYIKPVGTASELKAQSDEIVNLIDRVEDLENNKQDNLVAGEGVEIAGNNEISIIDDITGLPDRVDTIEQTLQNLNEDKVDVATASEMYYTKGDTYTKDEVNTIVNNVVNNPVIQDAGGNAISVILVDEFTNDDLNIVLGLGNN